jgi:outer membrane protein
MKNSVIISLMLLLGLFSMPAVSSAQAAKEQGKVGTISVQEILGESKVGRKAQETLQAKVDEYQKKFSAEEQQIQALGQEIEKKSSVWSEAVRSERERDYQRRVRELQLKSEDARFDLQQFEKQIMEPILMELHAIIAEFGKKNGYTLILENTRKGLLSRSGLLYADDSLDLSDQMRKELDSRMNK